MTFDFSREVRLSISREVGKREPASYDECRQWIDTVVGSTLESLYTEEEEEGAEE